MVTIKEYMEIGLSLAEAKDALVADTAAAAADAALTVSSGTKIEFPQGIFFNKAAAKAPSWIIGDVVVKREAFIQWAALQPDDTIRLTASAARSGKTFLKVNNWKPTRKAEGGDEK